MNEKLESLGVVKLPKPKEAFDCTYGSVNIPWYNEVENVNIIFEREDQEEEPSENQVEALCNLLSERNIFFSNVEENLFQYYNQCRKESLLSEETKKSLFPNLTKPFDLKSLVKPPTLLVSYYEGDSWSDYIGLLMECTWEKEHGLGVKVVDNQIEEIGFQDIVI